MNQCEYSEHHSLITSSKVIKKFFHFFLLLFHIVRNCGRKVVIYILLSLPVGNIGFNTEKSALSFSYCLICWNGDNVNRHHKVAVHIRKFGNHIILNIWSVFSEEKHSTVTVAYLKIILFKLKRIGTNIVLEIVSLFAGFFNIKTICGFLSDSVKIVNDAKSLISFKFNTFAAQSCKVCNQVSTHTSKICSCVLHTLFIYWDSDILILNGSIGTGSLIKKHFVIFFSIHIQLISGFGNKYSFFKIQTVEPSVIDSEFCCSTAIQRVKQFGIFKEHSLLILTTRNGIVNIRKLKCLWIFISADSKNTVIIDSVNGNTILHSLWHYKLFFILLEQVWKCFNHCISLPPFRYKKSPLN